MAIINAFFVFLKCFETHFSHLTQLFSVPIYFSGNNLAIIYIFLFYLLLFQNSSWIIWLSFLVIDGFRNSSFEIEFFWRKSLKMAWIPFAMPIVQVYIGCLSKIQNSSSGIKMKTKNWMKHKMERVVCVYV